MAERTKQMKNAKLKTKQSVKCDIPVTQIEYWTGDTIQLKPNSTYSLVIDYPFNIPTTYPVKVGAKGIGMVGLLSHIGKAFDKKYASIDNVKGAKSSTKSILVNKVCEADNGDGYWHGIEDLVIEGIKVNHETKKITLSIGELIR